jgi:hypothetical protein
MGKLERAKIYALDGDGKDKSKLAEPKDGIDVCFNPKEYTLEKSITWSAEKAHSDAPMPEFKEPTAMTLSVTLQFDTYEERVSVREKYTRKIEALTLMRGDPANEKDVKKHSPPVVLFVWGRMTFKGVIESLSQRYTMFLADGTPVRAECSLKLRNVLEHRIDDDLASFSKSMGGGRHYTVQQGDRLDSIAASQLGDSSRWSEIAMANNIDDPLKELSAGTPLTIPSDE